MNSDMLIHIFALVFLIVSFVMAILAPDQLRGSTIWALWAIALIVVFSGFPWGLK